MSATMTQQQHLDRAVVVSHSAMLVFFSMFFSALLTCVPILSVFLTGLGLVLVQVIIAVTLLWRSNWHSKKGVA